MCGIAGIVRRDGQQVQRGVLEAMTQVLTHRGPDAEGFWLDGAVGFGHRRLAIRDLTIAGHQPMHDSSGRVTISYNGEIYNDQELRRALERDFGVKFRSTCDAEVIPYGYLAWGEAVFGMLEGMFAIALWDARNTELILARDGVGIKPLFFSETESTLRFASEVKGLLADPDQSRGIDPAALHKFLAQGYVGPNLTLIEGIEQIKPGHYYVFENGQRREERFWRPERRPEITSLEEGLDEFRGTWNQVVQDMLVSDVPLGVLQSGGIDSSLVSLSLASQRKDAPLFTAAFEEASYDETAAADSVAKATGLPHRTVAVTTPGGAEELFRKIVYHFDGQVADSSAYAYYRLAAAVRREVTVALSGDGGDELFGGYPTYRASRLAAALIPIVPRFLAAAIGRAALRISGGSERRLPISEVVARFAQGLAMAESGLEAHAQWRRLLPQSMIRNVYGSALKPFIAVDPFAAYTEAGARSGGGLVDRCMSADQRFYLPGNLLMKTDAMSMAHGLEIRVPFLDRRIVDIAGRMDARLLTPFLGLDKKLLRVAAQRYGAPSEIVRTRKRGFNVPIARLLRNDLRSLAERYCNLEAEVFEPFINPEGLRAIWREHAARKSNHGYVLWALLTFAVWRQSL